jgi:hypothetical protein
VPAEERASLRQPDASAEPRRGNRSDLSSPQQLRPLGWPLAKPEEPSLPAELPERELPERELPERERGTELPEAGPLQLQ